MNNNFKKLFLLPSLLLTQAYCFEQFVDINNNTNVEKYSEKIKINFENSDVKDTDLDEKNIVPNQEKIPKNEFLLFSLALATLATLFLKHKIKIKFNYKKFLFKKRIIIALKLIRETFYSIKSIKKLFYSTYHKLYFSLYIS
jgi:hypothetical protein